MKQIKSIIFLALIAFTLVSAGTHKFYVAIFQMDFVPEKEVIQMTSRVFIDDLELAFEKKYGKKFYFGTKKEIPEAKKYLIDYFDKNIEIVVNGEQKAIKYLGREIEDDVLVCYYTIPAKKVESIEIKNTTLFDAYREQQNMMHTNVNNTKKSLLLTYDKPKGKLEY